MSPAGVHDRLDVGIKQKFYLAASGGTLQVLGELAFSLRTGEVAALVGPSGCGKTTLLRVIADLAQQSEGEITVNGVSPSEARLARAYGYVFQAPALYPWRSVVRNVTLPLESTNLLSRLVDIWGDVPVPLLRHLDLRRSLYGYIGKKDRTMSPLLPPGTFVQIDARQTRVKKGSAEKGTGQSQFARPIYFLDIRTGYACGWCEIKEGHLTLIPHPDSGEQTRTFRYPSEVEVVGRVGGLVVVGRQLQVVGGAERHRRVMEVLRDDPRAADLVRALAELPEGDGGRQLADLDGEIGELHLAGQHVAQRTAAALRTADRDPASGNEERREEGKALDVIPVRVAEENRRRDGRGRLRRERGAERAGARPAIEQEAAAPARRHLDARGVAAETDGVRARHGDRSPGAPESRSHHRPGYSYFTWRPSR